MHVSGNMLLRDVTFLVYLLQLIIKNSLIEIKINDVSTFCELIINQPNINRHLFLISNYTKFCLSNMLLDNKI